MKIAINCSYFTPKGGGIKEYIYNLVINLNKVDTKNEYLFYILKDQEDFWKETFKELLNYKIIPFDKNQRISLALLSANFWKKEQKSEGFDIFHSPFFHIPKGISCKSIITVHDLRFMRFPESYERLRLIYLKYIVPKSLKKANHIISISEFTKKEIISFFKIPEDKITVIHEAIDLNRFNTNRIHPPKENDILKKFNLEKENYILSVGHIEPRKNYKRLITAFLKIKKKLPHNFKLVIVGKKNLHFKKIIELISENKNTILYKNFIDEDELITLYKNAKTFIFPTYYEGFGFPPLEAAALKTPSIVSDTSSLPEICGKDAYLFNPYNIDSIANSILNITTNANLHQDIKIKCIKNLDRFSWEKNAQETINVYDKIKS